MSAGERKAVILARGLGSRMRKSAPGAELSPDQAETAATGVKAMISVGRPFLDHVLSELADHGFTDVCLVIGPEHQVIRDYYQSLPRQRVRVSFAIQPEPKGTADALAAAEEFAGDQSVLVLNSDNFYPPAALKLMAEATGSAVAGFRRDALVAQSNIPADRIAAYALLASDPEGRLTRVVEKPTPAEVEAAGPEALISMNCWLCSPVIFQAIREIYPSPRGELELTDAVRRAIELGDEYRVYPVAAGVLDLSNQRDIAAVTEALAEHEVTL
ncbi:nucleotidyltransferase family protein [Actinomyces sp. F1_1611]